MCISTNLALCTYTYLIIYCNQGIYALSRTAPVYICIYICIHVYVYIRMHVRVFEFVYILLHVVFTTYDPSIDIVHVHTRMYIRIYIYKCKRLTGHVPRVHVLCMPPPTRTDCRLYTWSAAQAHRASTSTSQRRSLRRRHLRC